MILITGATGFIGRSLTRHLTAAGYEWQAYNGRINNPLHLRQQLAGVDVVIHLASSEARGRNRLLQHVDVEGTERLIEECRRAQVQQIIIVSRIGADSYSLQPLLRAKGDVERAVRGGSVPYTIIRAATLFGQGDRFSEIILGLAIWSWPLVWLPGGGTVAMQPLWIEDLARCLVQTVGRADLLRQTITVAGEERLRYQDIAREILTTAGLRRLPFNLPLVLLRPFTTLLFRWWHWPAVTAYFADHFFVSEVADLDSVLRVYGFRPAHLRETSAYLRRSGLRWRLFHR